MASSGGDPLYAQENRYSSRYGLYGGDVRIANSQLVVTFAGNSHSLSAAPLVPHRKTWWPRLRKRCQRAALSGPRVRTYQGTENPMTLKICHLISGDHWAGAEVMAFQLLSGLNALPGIDLFVILLNKGRLSDDLQNAGIPTYVLDEGKQSFLEITWLVTKAVRSWAPHILHSHRYKENILSYLVSLTLRKGASLVSTQHGMPEFHNGGPGPFLRVKNHTNN